MSVQVKLSKEKKTKHNDKNFVLSLGQRPTFLECNFVQKFHQIPFFMNKLTTCFTLTFPGTNSIPYVKACSPHCVLSYTRLNKL